jgi:hypothetical protein
MQRISQTLAITAALLATLPAAAATVSRMTSRGDDGKSYYDVACSDGTTASVVVDGSPRNVCIYADHLGRSCRPDWTVENAAAYACRTAPPGARTP